MKIFDETRPATLEDVSWLRKALARRLRDMRLHAELIDDFQLVVSEIGSNAVLHADPPPGEIHVAATLNGPTLDILIRDDGGGGRDWLTEFRAKTSAKTSAETGTDESPETDPLAVSGRGLALVEAALDRAEFSFDGGNLFRGRRNLMRKRPKVLLVEDTPALLAFYAGVLRRDYRLIRCHSLKQARAALAEQQIDVVLADIHLDDGLALSLPEVSAGADEGGPPPVILISADESLATRESALRNGAEFFLAKPVRPGALRAMVRIALARALGREARLARDFARHVDDLLKPELPTRFGAFRLGAGGGAPETGGGDLAMLLEGASHDRLAVVDVMGHGVGARAWAIAYVSILRTLQLLKPEAAASEFLQDLARIVAEDKSLEQALATALILDLDKDGVTVASAGHPAPIIFGSRIFRPDCLNPLLGILGPEPYCSARIALAPGDYLLLFTDGVDPAGVSAGELPPDWFMQAAQRREGEDFCAHLRRLDAATHEALGPNPPDDWTFVMIEKTADGAPAQASASPRRSGISSQSATMSTT